MEVAEPLLTINWDDAELGSPARRSLTVDYTDVSGYGYANPTSATDLKNIIDAYIISGWTDIGTGGDILNTKAQLLSHDGASDTILNGGTNEYILSRDDTTLTGLAWISKTAVGTGIWQPLDTDLTDIAALTPSNDDFLQRKSGAWTNRTIAQVKTDLGIPNLAFSKSSANQTLTASTNSTAVTDVTIAIAANKTMLIEIVAEIESSANNGWRVAVAIPAGASMFLAANGQQSATAAYGTTSWLTVSGVAGATTGQGGTMGAIISATQQVRITGWITTAGTSGTVDFLAAPANVANTVKVLSGSWIKGSYTT